MIGYKSKNHERYFLHTLIGFVLLFLSALISFDFNINEINIPITGQTLGVILVASISPFYSGVSAVILYLFLGGMGLPIFADGAAGWDVFKSGSGGFLIGFFFAALTIKLVKRRVENFSILHVLFLNVTGTIIILVFGITWLSKLYGFGKALEYGLYPFWIGAIVKIVLGAGIIFGLAKFRIIKSLQ